MCLICLAQLTYKLQGVLRHNRNTLTLLLNSNNNAYNLVQFVADVTKS